MQYSQHAIDSRPRHGVAAVFRPGLAPTLVVLALLPLLVALGCWQLSRAAEKRVLLAAAEARREAAPIPAAQLERLANPAYVRVRLQGRLDAEHTLLLDNRTRDGAAGVHAQQALVLVNYGGASGAQIQALAERIREDIRQRFGVELEMEPNLY